MPTDYDIGDAPQVPVPPTELWELARESHNVHLMFAALQETAADEKKEEADALIAEIEAENAIIKEAREHLAKARQLQAEAKSNNTYNSETSEMTAFRQKYGINFHSEGGDNMHWQDQWELNIKNLENFIETRGMNTQTMMVQLEDIMGKYNSWSQGAAQAVKDGAQLTQSLWKT
jgi:chromosome segregation ATPase